MTALSRSGLLFGFMVFSGALGKGAACAKAVAKPRFGRPMAHVPPAVSE